MLPALVGQLVVILKDSALGTAITYPELLQQAAKDVGTAYAQRHPGLRRRGADLHRHQLRADPAGAASSGGSTGAAARRAVTTNAPMIVQGGAEPGGVTAEEKAAI